MAANLRIAFFPDSLNEINGVARTSQALLATAAKRDVPVLCVCAGQRTRWVRASTGARLELERGPCSFPLEHDLRHDPLLWRHAGRVIEAVRAFRPDVVHMTGPSDVGQLAAFVASRLDLPLVGSWHTNLHEYAAWRVERRLRLLPSGARRQVSALVGRRSLWAALQFYRLPSVLLAPNMELVEFLRARTGKPTYLMRRGVDITLFSPAKRTVADGVFRLGFVGRLSAEKNVHLLARLERALLAAGCGGFRFLVVGDGSERASLEREMGCADFTGVLHGEPLAAAYANMDLLVFPSETDTFGNVVQEALASGTPVVVSSRGGPRFIVRDGVSGFVAAGEHDYLAGARILMADPQRHRCMRAAARRQALSASWNNVFNEVLEAYAAAASRSSCSEASSRATNGRAARNARVRSNRTVQAALGELVRHPVRSIWRRWHWKSAVLSALLRAALFFVTSLAGGRVLAGHAAGVEFVLRIPLVGVLAAAGQAFRDVEPPWAGNLVAMALLPALAHVAEFLVQRLAGTPDLAAGMSVSVALSILSTVFTLFVMRRGVMIVGSGAGAFRDDVRQLPRLLIEFVLVAPRALVRRLRGRHS